MMYDIEVKVSLKAGMLNPEATTIQRSLSLLGYEVKGTKTKEIISFVMEAESEDDARAKVDDMCQKLLCNPIIHNYTIKIIKMDFTCASCE
ncbi:phosphoribosylformylglycinamidine (FGAM) synthase PurS [Methanobrevibacter ruminantium M1]|uniref:Phosphoribosylformylglycinamidine synthase subunit PurS n=1 Tax=Methanobrevibacter ruminantium (strain ATCC 35063 / DSM 1093 / JCM 13430 / OCM 146 / M1) TaxID=634498 RepID=D3E4C8_METRM|nr:phosphoribosylformylglycinamidine synthase subunit PurS [Methanobrevibacter ruminantium]ADC47389.1 phosphoribosylformylglycinamidine (FGAM) synthase PurS [Methanobrevibacter ruminantium M1]